VAGGLILGLSIQFASAWNNPSTTPPEGNVPGPLTIGALGQSKVGNLIVNAGDATHIPAAIGLSANGFVQGVTGLCMGADCQTSWKNAVIAGSSVYIAAGDWFTITCNANGRYTPRAECADGTRPIACMYDTRDNGTMETGDESYTTYNNIHGPMNTGMLPLSYSTVTSFTNKLIPAGSKGGENISVSTNGACQMWYSCDSHDLFNGGTIRNRAVCVPAKSTIIQNPNKTGTGTIEQ